MDQALLLIHCLFNPYNNNPMRLDLLFSSFTNEETEAPKPEVPSQVAWPVSDGESQCRVRTLTTSNIASPERKALQAGDMACMSAGCACEKY